MLLGKIRTAMLAYLAITAGSAGAWCQESPLELASMVTQRWAGTSEADFGAAFPFREGREVFSETAQAQFDRRGGLAKVIHEGKEKAVLLISGVPLLENSGDATIESRGFSGFYEARKEGGRWALASRIPLDSQGRILGHRLSVRVRPADGLDVEDRMRIRAQGNNGFAVRLNYRAKVRQVKVDNTAVHYLFGGGLLWIDMQPGEATLTITYSISVEDGPNETNSGCFLRKAGHVRNPIPNALAEGKKRAANYCGN